MTSELAAVEVEGYLAPWLNCIIRRLSICTRVYLSLKASRAWIHCVKSFQCETRPLREQSSVTEQPSQDLLSLLLFSMMANPYVFYFSLIWIVIAQHFIEHELLHMKALVWAERNKAGYSCMLSQHIPYGGCIGDLGQVDRIAVLEPMPSCWFPKKIVSSDWFNGQCRKNGLA